jgi:hypothetical protein
MSEKAVNPEVVKSLGLSPDEFEMIKKYLAENQTLPN